MNDLASVIREKAARLREVEVEAATLRADLQQLREDLDEARKALDLVVPRRAVHKVKGTKKGLPRRGRVIKPTSTAGLALAALRRAGRPLTVDEIIEAVTEASGRRPDKNSTVGQLAWYVRREDTFTRPATSTYGLREWDASHVTRQPVLEIPKSQVIGGGRWTVA